MASLADIKNAIKQLPDDDIRQLASWLQTYQGESSAGDMAPDDTPNEVVLEGIRQGLDDALAGRVLPLAKLWDGIDAD